MESYMKASDLIGQTGRKDLTDAKHEIKDMARKFAAASGRLRPGLKPEPQAGES